MYQNRKNHRRLRGFTLIELLVVIVIIAVLASLTFVTVDRIRSSANAANSVSNIRQLYAGNLMYLADHNEFPGDSNWGSSKFPEENRVNCTSWYERVAPYIGLGVDLEETQQLFIPGELPPGILLIRGREREMEDAGGFRSGYMRNPQINQNHQRVTSTPPQSFRNLNSFTQPSSTYFLTDAGGESSELDMNWRISKADRLLWPAHGGEPNTLEGHIVVCYMDGGVASLKKGDIPFNHRNIFWLAPILSEE